jgi:hypothetical protein
VFHKLTDEEGVAVFQNLPMDSYEVEVVESSSFKAER